MVGFRARVAAILLVPAKAAATIAPLGDAASPAPARLTIFRDFASVDDLAALLALHQTRRPAVHDQSHYFNCYDEGLRAASRYCRQALGRVKYDDADAGFRHGEKFRHLLPDISMLWPNAPSFWPDDETIAITLILGRG